MYKKHNTITLRVWVTILELQIFTEIAIQLFSYWIVILGLRVLQVTTI